MDRKEARKLMLHYKDKSVRLNALKEYVLKYNSADALYTNDYYLWLAFNRNNHCIIEALKELGYEDIHTVLKRKPNKYYDNFETLETDLHNLINYFGRFPTLNEITSELNIDSRVIGKHGGIYEIKRKMNYNSKNDLKDLSGFYNKSSYEYIVANFLIKNNISYKREEHPFSDKDGNYRSDFSLERDDGSKIFIEVWGYSSNENIKYNKVKKEKKKLYNKYNFELISIEKSIFTSNNMLTINKKLEEIFSKYTDIKNSPIIQYSFIPTNDMSDEDILNVLLTISGDKDILPDVPLLKKEGKYPLYNEILKRYGSYFTFAEKYNKKNTRHQIGYWNKNKIFECFNNIIVKNIGITRKNIEKCGYSAMNDAIVDLGGLVQWKLDFYYEHKDLNIPEKDIQWLNNVSKNQGTNIKNKITQKQQNLANEILTRQNNITSQAS